MNGGAKIINDTDVNANNNGIKSKHDAATIVSDKVVGMTLKQQLPILMKGDFIDPIFGPKSGGISKSNSNLADVIVKNAVGPHNFIVQDYRQSKNLEKLEQDMTDFYTEYHKKTAPLDHIDVIPDGYYAVKVDSHKNWARVRVVKPFNYDNPQIMIFLLDHGCYSMTTAEHLRELRRMYVEKLPSQAYRAKLHFLGNVSSKWSTDECNRFRAECEGKSFCSIIVDEAQDTLFADQIPILSLVLIDTSGPHDRYVHQSFTKKR